MKLAIIHSLLYAESFLATKFYILLLVCPFCAMCEQQISRRPETSLLMNRIPPRRQQFIHLSALYFRTKSSPKSHKEPVIRIRLPDAFCNSKQDSQFFLRHWFCFQHYSQSLIFGSKEISADRILDDTTRAFARLR